MFDLFDFWCQEGSKKLALLLLRLNLAQRFVLRADISSAHLISGSENARTAQCTVDIDRRSFCSLCVACFCSLLSFSSRTLHKPAAAANNIMSRRRTAAQAAIHHY